MHSINPVILTAPAGFGKNKIAEITRRDFMLDKVVDEWKPGDQVELRTLYLTNAHPDKIKESGVAAVICAWGWDAI